MNRFKTRVLVALLGVLTVTAVLVAVLTRVLVDYHVRSVAYPPRSRPVVIEHLLGQVTSSLVLAVLVGAAVALAASVLLARVLARPLEKLAAGARELAQGRYEVRVEHDGLAEVADAAAAFNEMAAGLAAVEARRKELVTNISHELRTPLTSINGYVQGVLDGVFPPDEETLTAMLSETSRLIRLVEDLQLLARAEAADLPLRLKPIPLDELIGPVIGVLRPRLEERSIRLDMDLPVDLPPMRVDETWSRTALSNVLDNAARFTPRDGGIAIRARRAGQHLEIEIADTGPGIPQGDLPHIFERFYRADRSRAQGGSGVGLAIAKHVAERHGGAISANSQPGEGTTVLLRLPLSLLPRAEP